MRYLDRLKKEIAATQPTAKSAKSHDEQTPFFSYCSTPDRHIYKNLLSEVGAEVVQEDSRLVLRFKPFLAGPDIDSDRWDKANDLLAEYMNIRL